MKEVVTTNEQLAERHRYEKQAYEVKQAQDDINIKLKTLRKYSTDTAGLLNQRLASISDVLRSL